MLVRRIVFSIVVYYTWDGGEYTHTHTHAYVSNYSLFIQIISYLKSEIEREKVSQQIKNKNEKNKIWIFKKDVFIDLKFI